MKLANITIQLVFDKTEFWETAFEEIAGLFIGDLLLPVEIDMMHCPRNLATD